MAWHPIREHIAEVLGAVCVELPDETKIAIRHAYELPPKSVGEFPVFVVMPPDDIAIDRMNGVRTETCPVRCIYIALTGGDDEGAADMAELFREAAVAAFDEHTTLGGHGTLLSQSVGPVVLDRFANRDVAVFETTLEIRHDSLVTIA